MLEHSANIDQRRVALRRIIADFPSRGFSPPRRRPILKGTEDVMPLPHFLILMLAVILAAGLTIWAASAVGIPLFALALLALAAAGIAHLSTRDDHPH